MQTNLCQQAITIYFRKEQLFSEPYILSHIEVYFAIKIIKFQ